MSLLGEIRRRARHIVGPVLALALFGYFAYHAVQGDRGLIAWIKLSQRVQDAQAERARILAARLALEQRVRLMSPESLDRDLLEEQVRLMLGYVRRDEVVVEDRAAPGHAALMAGVPSLLSSPRYGLTQRISLSR